MQALAFVYSKKDYVDANDPTAPSNTAKKLSNWGFGNSRVCSSTAGDSSSRIVALDRNGIATAQNDMVNYYGVIPILEIPLYKDRTGERVDGKATIAGKLGNYWIAVLDAAYRAENLKFGKYNIDLPGLQNTSANYTLYYTWEESMILAQGRDVQTSKKNTDYLKTVNSGTDEIGVTGVPAAAHCFTQTILGTNAQLPNMQTMAFVKAKTQFIDGRDPTANANSTLTLAAVNMPFATSTENATNANMCVQYTNKVNALAKASSYRVAPVYEIPLWCDDDYK